MPVEMPDLESQNMCIYIYNYMSDKVMSDRMSGKMSEIRSDRMSVGFHITGRS